MSVDIVEDVVGVNASIWVVHYFYLGSREALATVAVESVYATLSQELYHQVMGFSEMEHATGFLLSLPAEGCAFSKSSYVVAKSVSSTLGDVAETRRNRWIPPGTA